MSNIPASSTRSHTPPPPTRALRSDEETLAYLELSEREVFAVAYALVTHCQRVGTPTNGLQQEIAGLRDFLLDLLADHHVEKLLQSI